MMAFTIPASHPALPGHFPGHPIVPAVVILDEMAEQLRAFSPGARIVKVASAKFTAPLAPGERCTVTFARRADGLVRFTCATSEREVASGWLELGEPLP